MRFAVAIGNDVGLAVEEPLRWAESDAQRIRDVMVDLGGVVASRAVTLLGTRPREVEEALLVIRGQLAEARRRGDRTELVVSYSGHGDNERLHLGDEVLPIARLMALLDAAGADATVVILDACRGQAQRAGRSRGARPAPGFDVRFVDELAPHGRVVMSSASNGEVAQESDDLEGAFFTHHVLAGLRGAADVDHDGAVSLHELFGYAHARTLGGSFGSAPVVQHPELSTSMRGQSDLVLTRLERSQAIVVFAADVGGRFLVADARSGRVLVEVDKPRGVPLRLAVPARRLRVLGRRGAASSVAEVDVARGATVTLDDNDFAQTVRLVGRTRGGDLDVTPHTLLLGWQLSTPVTLPIWPTPHQIVGAPASGLVARYERRLGETPWSIGVHIGGAHAGGAVAGGVDVTGVADVVFDEWSARALVPLTAEQWTPLGRLTAGLGGGGVAVLQRRERTDGARLSAAGLSVPLEDTSLAAGPLGVLQGGWWIPVRKGVGVVGMVDVGAAALPIDGAVRGVLQVGVSIGVGGEL